MSKRDIVGKTAMRITLTSMGILMGCLLIFAIFVQFFYQLRVFDNIDQQLLSHKNMVVRNPQIIKMVDGNEEVHLSPPMTANLLSFVWKEDRLLDESPHEYLGTDTYPSFPNEYNGDIITLKNGDYYYRGIQFEKEGLRIELLISVNGEIRSAKQLTQALGLGFCILFFIALGLSSYLSKIILKPIKTAYEKQVFFVQDASHEMRTPLAVIKGRIELLACHTHDRLEDHLEELAGIMTEIRALEKLNSDLLTLSKEDIGGEAALSTLSANDLIQEVEEFYKDLAQLQNKVFEVKYLNEDKEVMWDRTKVRRCLTILLENAFKYTDEGDVVKLIVEATYKEIHIKVVDSGCGISEEEQERIFDRFFRSSEVRAKGIEGSGIGLSLLKSLAYTLGIRIKLKSKYHEGTEFTLQIPNQMR